MEKTLTNFYFFIWFIITALLTKDKVNATCPSGCTCIAQEKAIPASYCDNQKLTRVPKNIAKNTEILSLRLNNIRNITDEDFVGLYHLKKLDFVFNGIHTISDNAFKDLRKLQSLNLGHNAIKGLSTNIFRNLISLEELFINNNLLITLPKDIFRFLPNLKKISLQSNQIMTDSNEVFSNLHHLEKLNLAHNKINVVTSRMFENSRALRYLYLDDNKLKNIDPNAFRSLEKLTEVYLDNNALLTVSENLLKNKSYLSRVSLYNNPLQCDCNLFWVHNAMVKRRPAFQHSEHMICQSPLTLKGEHISLTWIKSPEGFNCYGSWSSWLAWSDCSKPCSGGLRYRSRVCNKNVGSSCKGDEMESQTCNTFPCSNGVFTHWSGWSVCSVSCNEGARRRARRCIHPYTGTETASCVGPLSETKFCMENQCAVDGSWSEWSSWSGCNKTCGFGMSSRTRTCTNPPPRFGGLLCDDSHNQMQNRVCIAAVCSPHTSWGAWSEFSRCSVSCGNGRKVRTRECLNKFNEPIKISNICPGSQFDAVQCNASSVLCKQNGIWSSWLPWSRCDSFSCRRYRSRICESSTSKYGKKECVGKAREHKACDPKHCVLLGIWSQWLSWSLCSKSCGGGTRSRTRRCPGEQYKQVRCGAKRWEAGKCNLQPCKLPSWSGWSSWSKCLTRGGKVNTVGRRVRKRMCSGIGGEGCLGSSKERKRCVVASPEVIKRPNECQRRVRIRNGKEKYTRIGNTIIAEYSCDEYYKLKGPSSRMTCVKGRKWSSRKYPYCAPVCGRPVYKSNNHWSNRARLRGGKLTARHSWPWQVAIEVKTSKEGWKLRCGGSLLNEKWVLTAAHCLVELQTDRVYKPHEFRIFLGVHNVTERYKNKEIQIFYGKSIHMHHGYVPNTLDNDIGLIEIKKRAKLSDKVLPVCLPKRKQKDVPLKGKVGTVVGWGQTSENKASEVLKELRLPVVSQRDCKLAYKNQYAVTDSMFCAGLKYKSHDTCPGDSGGGYVFQDLTKKRAKWILQGIVSWGGDSCGEPGKFGVYTRVYKFTDWIKRKMSEKL